MTASPVLPPLPTAGAPATDAGEAEGKQVTLARAHEDAAPPPATPGPGHNLLGPLQRDLLRSAIARVRRIQAEIDRLQAEKSAAYQTLRQNEVDPALARKVVYRLGLSAAELDAIAERDALLAAYWDAVADLRVDDDPEADPDADPAE